MNSEHSNLTLRSAFVWHFQSAKVFLVFLCVQYIVFDYHTFNLYGTGHTRNEEKKKHTKEEVAACVFTKWWCRNLLFFATFNFKLSVIIERQIACIYWTNAYQKIPPINLQIMRTFIKIRILQSHIWYGICCQDDAIYSLYTS